MRQPTPKVMPSPGRTDKFLPPLMRFLRSNVGSKSRGRSKSRRGPLFLRRKKNTAIVEVHQEPSSPKVTCIGQVRVRRSNSKRPKKPDVLTRNPSTRQPTAQKSQWCLCSSSSSCFAVMKCNNTKPSTSSSSSLCFCPSTQPGCSCPSLPRPGCSCPSLPRPGCSCPSLPRPGCSCPSLKPIWRRLVSFFCCGSYWVGPSSSTKNGSKGVGSGKVDAEEEEDEDADREEERGGGFVERERANRAIGSDPSTTTPPKNALLLTRCRSAPYRSSSLAVRFWGSPLLDEEDDHDLRSRRTMTAGEEEEEEGEQESRESTAVESAASEIEQPRRDSAAKSITDRDEGNLGFWEGEIDASSKENVDDGDGEGEESEKNPEQPTSTPTTTASTSTSTVANTKPVQQLVQEKDERFSDDAEMPVVLTRCKSVPSSWKRSDPNTNPETAIFWR